MQIDLSLDDVLQSVIRQFDAAPRQTNKAIQRSLRKLSRYAERQVLRTLARQTGVTQKLFKSMGRIKVSLLHPGERGNDDYVLVIWVGLADIPAHYLGKPFQSRTGVRTGRWQWPGAFTFQPANSSHPMVFQRAPHWRHKKQLSRRSGQLIWMGLPIEKQGLPITSKAQAAIEQLIPELLQRFQTLMQQELNYAFNIEHYP